LRIHTTPRPLGEPPIGAIAMVPLFGLPFGAWLIESGTFELSECGFKRAFDLPCLSCGSTRATIHLFHGEFLTALSFQPMTMLVYSILLTWGSLSLWAFATNRALHIDLSKAEDIGLKLALLFVPLANWGYLVQAGI